MKGVVIVNLKFIYLCSHKYDFEDNGRRVTGATAYCYDDKNNRIVKVKIASGQPLNLKFGDVLDVHLDLTGRFIKYFV